jgi:hypothetical protein
VSYSYVAKYVVRRRPEIEAESRGQAGSLEGFVPQAKEPGAEAEVDFGPVMVELDGRDADCHLFAYRLSYSGLGCTGSTRPARRRRCWRARDRVRGDGRGADGAHPL